jgi:hypothetical protein
MVSLKRGIVTTTTPLGNAADFVGASSCFVSSFRASSVDFSFESSVAVASPSASKAEISSPLPISNESYKRCFTLWYSYM